MKYLFDCRATSLCTTKILWKHLSFSELFRSYFAVFAEGFRKFGVRISQRSICLNTSVKGSNDIMDTSWRHTENLSNARWIDIMDMQQFCCHMAGVDDLRFSGFRQDGIFGYVKFFGYNINDVVGEFGNLRHDAGLLSGANEQKSTPHVVKVYKR